MPEQRSLRPLDSDFRYCLAPAGISSAMKVFVSGCTNDMGGFRKEVADQLHRLGVKSVVQDLFEVSPQELPRLLLDKINESDAVICLVGKVFGFAPQGSERSYTQKEYDIAVELGKPTFLFFPSEKCTLPVAAPEADLLRRLQEAHVARLKASTHLWYEFNDQNHLRLLTDGVVFELNPKMVGGLIAHVVRTDFPTPLALLYHELIGVGSSDKLRLLIAESMRFLGLLALHDGAVHRIVGLDNADTPERIQSLARPKLKDWRVLLRLACAEECDKRFIKQFSGWEGRNSSTIDQLLKSYDDLSEDAILDLQRIAAALGRSLDALLYACDWLREYVLISVEEAAPGPNGFRARVFRGLAPRAVPFTEDTGSQLRPRPGSLYLLRMSNRQALSLDPAFGTLGDGSERQVTGWAALAGEPEAGPVARHSTFNRRQTVSVPADEDFQRAAANWLGTELARRLFHSAPPEDPVCRVGKLLDDASWDALDKLVLPAGDEQFVLAGRFRTKGRALHQGLHANLYEVDSIGTAENSTAALPAEALVHVLPSKAASDQAILDWFQARAECWRLTTSDGVLPLYNPESAGGVSGGPPFLLTTRIANATTIEKALHSGSPLDARLVQAVLDLAFSACAAAHASGVLLLALPLRHFLLDQGGRLHLTGFDAAIRFKDGDAFPPGLSGRLRKFAREFSVNEGIAAPELDNEKGHLAKSIDVFAIGALLQRLLGRPVRPRPARDEDHEGGDGMWGSWRQDPMECFVLHCLARDPRRRFQSVEQCRHIFDRFCRGAVPAAPETVELSDAIWIGRHPVTNFEYERYCREVRQVPPTRPLEPRHCGPFAPVVNVSVRDAVAYCAWLTRRDALGVKWRIPTDEEWTRAAGSASFPWGDVAPTRHHANWFGAFAGPTAVGSHRAGRSKCGCEDLAGNVWEWCADPAEEEPRRIVRGGSFASPEGELTAPSRQTRHFGGQFADVGFRVTTTVN